MTQAVAQILSEVERLSRAEQSELRQRICERVPMLDDLTDEDFAALATLLPRTGRGGDSRCLSGERYGRWISASRRKFALPWSSACRTPDCDRALIGVVPHTTATRGSQFEISHPHSLAVRGRVPRSGRSGSPSKVFPAPAGQTNGGADASRRRGVSWVAGHFRHLAPRFDMWVRFRRFWLDYRQQD